MPAQPLTLQQRFDQAKQHAIGAECAQAVPEFEAIETNPAFKNGSLPWAMIAVLKGQCLVSIGRASEGEQAIGRGLPRLRSGGAAFNIDVASALVSLGDAAMSRWDYAGGRGFYEQARAIPGATDPSLINIKLAQATAFDGGDAPVAFADAAYRAAQTAPGITNDKLAQLLTLRGRILLNQGRNQEAYADLKEALKLSGGLGLTVSLADIVMRGDLAVAARLTGDDMAARKYLAYAGAGRTGESPFSRAINMAVPVCGAETGLRREDFAVVDFAIGPDGRVISARTVYTRGSADVASRFAEAVSNWIWDSENLKNIPPFFLHATRVEVRCTDAGQQVPGLMAPIEARFGNWALAQLDIRAVADRTGLVTRLRAMDLPDDAVKRAAYLGVRATVEPMAYPAQAAMLEQALAAAQIGVLPIEARNYLTIAHHLAAAKSKDRNKGENSAYFRDLLTVLKRPEIADDAIATATIRVLAASPYDKRSQLDDTTDLLEQVASDTRLEDLHPLRQAANLRLADRAAQQKDYAKAQSYFHATGLTEEQCSLLGMTPAMRSAPISFPNEAYQYGFEGWVSMEFDIEADGRTSGVRPIIAYPPFVFAKAATEGLARARFESSFRPSGNQACSAQNRTIKFVQ